MAHSPSAWSRPYHESQGGTASVVLFVFADRPLDLDAPVSRSRHGIPVEFDFASVDVREHLRSEAPEWLDGFFTREMLSIAEPVLGDKVGRLTDMDVVYSVRLELEEPTDLGYLQSCWGAASWLCECGAEFVHDAAAIRWHNSERIAGLDPLRDLAMEHEIAVVLETDARPGFGYVTHTRGLVKFGRPDIVLLGAEPEDARASAALLNGLALRAARGALLQADQTVTARPLSPRRLSPYEPGVTHPELHLNNEGLVLDIRDWGLRKLV
jgi:hypothetical protein